MSDNELVIYALEGQVSRRIPMTRDEHDRTKWHLAEPFALVAGESDVVYAKLATDDPIDPTLLKLPRSSVTSGAPINTLFLTEAPKAGLEGQATTNKRLRFDSLDELRRTLEVNPMAATEWVSVEVDGEEFLVAFEFGSNVGEPLIYSFTFSAYAGERGEWEPRAVYQVLGR